MANPSKRAGTQGEHMVVDILHNWGLEDAYRLGNNSPSNDIGGLSIPVEVKRRDAWSVPAWTRKIRAVHDTRWALFALPRDARKATAPLPVMIVDAGFGAYLLSLHEANMRYVNDTD